MTLVLTIKNQGFCFFESPNPLDFKGAR